MRRLLATLGVLLVASLLLNAALLFRKSEDRIPEGKLPQASLRRELKDPEKPSPAPETRVMEPKAERAVSTSSGTGSADPRLAAFREKVRRRERSSRKAERGGLSAADSLDHTESHTEFSRFRLARGQEPRVYLDAITILLETQMEADQLPLSPGQSAELSRALKEVEEELRAIASLPALERMTREIEFDAALHPRIEGLLTDEQRKMLSLRICDWDPGQDSNAHSILRREAEERILEAWTREYGLLEFQKPAALTAARSYVSEVDRLAGASKLGYRTSYQKGPAGTAYRLQAARAQVLAIQSLQGVLSPEQLKRLLGEVPREFFFIEEAPDAHK